MWFSPSSDNLNTFLYNIFKQASVLQATSPVLLNDENYEPSNAQINDVAT